MAYERIQPGHPSYDICEARKAAGVTTCDAADHNEPGGCSNPTCWKFELRKKRQL